ncbi:MAG: hypothetical protein ACLR60_03575 [Clostridium paraputrificum]
MDSNIRHKLIEMAVDKLEPECITIDRTNDIVNNLITEINASLKQDNNKLGVKQYENGSIEVKCKGATLHISVENEKSISITWTKIEQKIFKIYYDTNYKIVYYNDKYDSKESDKLEDILEWLILNIIIREQ